MPPIHSILFDLDGTLIDHFSAIHRSVAYAQERLGLPVSDYATVRATVGGSVSITLARLLGDASQVEAAMPHFRQQFDAIMLDDVAVLPGAAELLAALSAEGYQTAVFTNKFADHARAVLAHLGLDRWLDEIIGTGEGNHRKPEPEFTRHALDRLGASAEHSILVGDSPFDFEAAAAVGLPAYLVATGSHSEAQLAAETQAAGIYPDLACLGRSVFGLKLAARSPAIEGA